MPERPQDWIHTTEPDFPIVVPQPKGSHPTALLALRQEGYDPITAECDENYGYGELLASAWERGGFVVVEHDVAPWWGAVRELWECDQPFCAFAYPQGTAEHLRPEPHIALGCTKFSNELVAEFSLADRLRTAHWYSAQEVILPTLWQAGYHAHEHWPPVAHARAQAE